MMRSPPLATGEKAAKNGFQIEIEKSHDRHFVS